MTQLPDMSSLRTRGLDAALRAIGFVLWFSFILFCVGLNQSNGLASADDAFLAITVKSLASGLGYATWQAVSDMPRRSQSSLRKLRILSYSFQGDRVLH